MKSDQNKIDYLSGKRSYFVSEVGGEHNCIAAVGVVDRAFVRLVRRLRRVVDNLSAPGSVIQRGDVSVKFLREFPPSWPEYLPGVEMGPIWIPSPWAAPWILRPHALKVECPGVQVWSSSVASVRMVTWLGDLSVETDDLSQVIVDLMEWENEEFDPAGSFDSPDEVIEKAGAVASDPDEALKLIMETVGYNASMGEFGFASEVVALINTFH